MEFTAGWNHHLGGELLGGVVRAGIDYTLVFCQLLTPVAAHHGIIFNLHF